MDEQTKDLARQYMSKMRKSIGSVEKLPVKLGEVQQTTALLLGWYGTVVENRGVELKMDEATLSKIERVVKWMHESPKRGLLLCGTLGNGKTTMLRAIKNMFGSQAVYFDAQSLYDYYRQNQSLPQISAKDLLLIDDLGVEPSTYNDFGEIRYPLAEMLMVRYRMNATTIIATNYTFEQIAETYGDRVEDRMREMFAMIRYIEPSYRR